MIIVLCIGTVCRIICGSMISEWSSIFGAKEGQGKGRGKRVSRRRVANSCEYEIDGRKSTQKKKPRSG